MYIVQYSSHKTKQINTCRQMDKMAIVHVKCTFEWCVRASSTMPVCHIELLLLDDTMLWLVISKQCETHIQRQVYSTPTLTLTHSQTNNRLALCVRTVFRIDTDRYAGFRVRVRARMKNFNRNDSIQTSQFHTGSIKN